MVGVYIWVREIKKRGGDMENATVITVMILLAAVSKNKSLPILIAAAAGVASLSQLIDDIALYYAFISLGSVSLAFMSLTDVNKHKVCSLSFCILLITQSILCLLLIPDWGEIGNNALQYILTKYNGILWVILILIGLISSERFNFASSSPGGSGDNNCNRNRDHD